MNELFYSLIFIVIIIVLILVFILMSYFYNTYNENKSNVNNNFKKTTSYINTTNTELSKNINNLNNNINSVDSNYKEITNTIKKDITSKYDLTNSNIISLSNNLNTTITNNDTNFDNNMKQYFEFKNAGNKINESLFKYKFGISPSLSLGLLQKLDVASGMTINTDDTSSKFFRVCDNTVNSSNCVDLNVKNGSFNIKPSDLTNNNINNLNILSKTNQSLANFDLANNSIYLGNTGENAGLYIKNSKVYTKDLNILQKDYNYANIDKAVSYNPENPTAPFNLYNYDLNNIGQIEKFIKGTFTITKISGTPDNYNIVMSISSKYIIPPSTMISVDIPELSLITTSTSLGISTTNVDKFNQMSVIGYTFSVSTSTNIAPNTIITYTLSGLSSISFANTSLSTITKKILISF